MHSPRLIVSCLALAAALALTGCGQKETAKAPAPKPAPAPAPKVAEEAPKAETGAKPHPKLEGLAAVRIEGGYVTVLYENGRKTLFPATDLTEDENTWLTSFAAAHPLPHGKSTVVTAKTVAKKTIEKQSLVDGTETVQLCPPAKLRDQIGGTCMFYGRVHYLDIAGYPIEDAEDLPHHQPRPARRALPGPALLRRDYDAFPAPDTEHRRPCP